MSCFIVRVEPYGAPTYADYEQLHAAMRRCGFSLIVEVNGTDRRLPTAEYFHEDNATIKAILDKAKAAVLTTGKQAAILVSHVTDALADGLNAA